LKPGMVVQLWNSHWGKLLKMGNSDVEARSSPGRHDVDSHEADTLFLVVDRDKGNGEIALYNVHHRKFVKTCSWFCIDPVMDYGPKDIDYINTGVRKSWTSFDWIEKPIGNGKIALWSTYKKKFIQYTSGSGKVSLSSYRADGNLLSWQHPAKWYVNLGATMYDPSESMRSYSSVSGERYRESRVFPPSSAPASAREYVPKKNGVDQRCDQLDPPAGTGEMTCEHCTQYTDGTQAKEDKYRCVFASGSCATQQTLLSGGGTCKGNDSRCADLS
jgi:hypothetical protein